MSGNIIKFDVEQALKDNEKLKDIEKALEMNQIVNDENDFDYINNEFDEDEVVEIVDLVVRKLLHGDQRIDYNIKNGKVVGYRIDAQGLCRIDIRSV